MKNIDLLETNWLNLTAKFAIDRQQGKLVFSDLTKAYSNRARKYHSLNHIRHLLKLIEEAQTIAQSVPVLELSAWFHDYIYDPQANDNEVQSAIYAEQTFKTLNISSDIIQLVKQIILSTQKHQPLVNSVDNLIFLDADLGILGTSCDKYLEYVQAIRQEYSYLNDRQFKQGRKQVLTNFLSRSRIYYTDYFYQKFELTARANLTREISFYQ